MQAKKDVKDSETILLSNTGGKTKGVLGMGGPTRKIGGIGKSELRAHRQYLKPHACILHHSSNSKQRHNDLAKDKSKGENKEKKGMQT